MPNLHNRRNMETIQHGCDFDFLRSRNVIYTSIFHGYGDLKPQRFTDYDLELSLTSSVT